MSYAVSGNVKEFTLDGYPEGKPLVPHGLSVIINAPAVFRFTSTTNPERHLEAAKLLGVDVSNELPEKAGNLISNKLIDFIKKLGMPNGLRGLGYEESDIDNLVEGTLPQHRVTKLSPVEVGASELRNLFEESFELW
jgi:hydroxyacid-oxoacid transhydrogenase